MGVGLLYQQGYFRQYLNQAGWQQEDYPSNDFHNLPVSLAAGPDGKPVVVEVAFPGRQVKAQVWRAQVGRVALYLLDTNFADNARAEDRDITDQLYGGDREMRIRQEIVLGIGGYRALEALGLEPTVYHMNEGHSAFLALERVRRLMETRRMSFAEARELASASLVFTTHTPVEAGHDYFSPDLMDRYFGDYARGLGLSRDEFLGLGRRSAAGEGDFCMTVLALRLASFRNGVSKLHGDVSRRMWQPHVAGRAGEEVPIGHVTNGVHFRSWISLEMNQLYDRYLGPELARGAGQQRCLAPYLLHSRRGALADAREAEGTAGLLGAHATSGRSGSAAARRSRKSRMPRRCSIPTRSPSASRGGSPRTSAPRCCFATSTGSSAFWATPPGPCS